MRQLPVLTLIALVFDTQAFGTLITVVPANGGVVIAADSRTEFAKTYCDGVSKLFRPNLRRNTVVFEAGTSTVIPFDTEPTTNVCEYMESTSPTLDINALILNLLDSKATQLLSEAEVRSIANECLSRVRAFDDVNRILYPLRHYLTDGGFIAFIVSYDANHETTLIGRFAIGIGPTGGPLLGAVEFHECLKTEKMILVDGVKEWAESYVPPFVGRKFLAPVDLNYRQTNGQRSLTDAQHGAERLISATEITARIIVNPPVGVGGPIDVWTITKTGIEAKRYSSMDDK